MTNKFLLDLHLFDEGGEADEASQAETAGTTAESQNATGSGEEQTEDLDKEFDELIKGKYKEQFRARQQKAVQSRLKSHEADRAELESANKLKDTIAVRYGLQNASTADILKAIENDSSFLEEAAAREGLSPEQFQKMAGMQQRMIEAERKADQAERARIRDEVNARLQAESDECKALFPDFDFEEECQNETFKNMVSQGANVVDAYKFAHMDELISSGMAKAAARGAKATANAVKANLSRPTEAGARNGPAATFAVDFSKMSSEEFAKYRDKVMSGEI